MPRKALRCADICVDTGIGVANLGSTTLAGALDSNATGVGAEVATGMVLLVITLGSMLWAASAPCVRAVLLVSN